MKLLTLAAAPLLLLMAGCYGSAMPTSDSANTPATIPAPDGSEVDAEAPTAPSAPSLSEIDTPTGS